MDIEKIVGNVWGAIVAIAITSYLILRLWGMCYGLFGKL